MMHKIIGLRGRCGLSILTAVAVCLSTPCRAAVYSTLLSGVGQDFALAVATDRQGNVYVAGLTYSLDFPVTPGAYQTKFGGTCDAFIAKLDPGGRPIWSTYLGGILDDWATSIALDGQGNVLVAGYTRSADFPLANALQTQLDHGIGDAYDAFVAKLDPSGGKLLYSTFLGGQDLDGADALAVDPAGNAYVAVSSYSAAGYPGAQNAPNQPGIFVSELAPEGALVYSYFHPYGSAAAIALDAAGNIYVAGSGNAAEPSSATRTFGPLGATYAIVFKLAPDGLSKLYEAALGGSASTTAAALAVDREGDVYLGGSTTSADLPLVHALQTSSGARPLWRSTDGGVTWAPLDNLPFALPQQTVADPSSPSTLYEASADAGVLKSLDGGITWTRRNNGIAPASAQAIAMDPLHTQTLYAAAAGAVYKSTDGAASWSRIDTPSFAVTALAVDEQNPPTVYESGNSIRKSTDGGATWSAVTFPAAVALFGIDPRAAGHLFAVSEPVFGGFFSGNYQPSYLYRSVDGGATWIEVQAASQLFYPGFATDTSTTPSTIYAGLYLRSTDGGVTWSSIPSLPFSPSSVIALAIDPAGTIDAAIDRQGIFVSRDGAQTWTAVESPSAPPYGSLNGPGVTALIPAGAGGALYAAVGQVATSGFITKLNADGSALLFSTYLGGHATRGPIIEYLAEPSVMITQNWIAALALDRAGNLAIAGGTRTLDFPSVNAEQSAPGGSADAFAAILSADGSTLQEATVLGGSGDDGALALGIDPENNLVLAGQTWSPDFPIPGQAAAQAVYGDAFVVKLAAAPHYQRHRLR